MEKEEELEALQQEYLEETMEVEESEVFVEMVATMEELITGGKFVYHKLEVAVD